MEPNWLLDALEVRPAAFSSKNRSCGRSFAAATGSGLNFSLSLSRLSATSSRQYQKVVCEHRRSHCRHEVFPALVHTTPQSETTLQKRDASLDTSAESLRRPKRFAVFSQRFFRCTRALLADRHDFDVRLESLDFLHALVEAFVCRKLRRIIAELFPMTLERRVDQRMIYRFFCEHLVVCDELPLDLLDRNHMAKLDGLACFAPFQEFGMRLEDAENLFVVWNLLALKYSASSLIDDLQTELLEVLDLIDHTLEDNRTYQAIRIRVEARLQTLANRTGAIR